MFALFRRSTRAPVVAPAAVIDLARRASADGTPTRIPADRAAHGDDQHLVFWNAEASKASASHLSQAAAAWLQAVSTQPAVTGSDIPRIGRA